MRNVVLTCCRCKLMTLLFTGIGVAIGSQQLQLQSGMLLKRIQTVAIFLISISPISLFSYFMTHD